MKKEEYIVCILFLWRRKGDSNPRYSYPYDSLANCWFQPLTHLSVALHIPLRALCIRFLTVVCLNCRSLFKSGCKGTLFFWFVQILFGVLSAFYTFFCICRIFVVPLPPILLAEPKSIAYQLSLLLWEINTRRDTLLKWLWKKTER